MKKWVYLLTILLLLPTVTATITLEGPTNTIYNVGDKAHITGYITETKDTFGLFKIDLNCEGTVQLLTKLISLKKNQKEQFAEDLPLPFYMGGTCTFKASLAVNNAIIDEATSKTFTISKELKGTFTTDKTNLQLGESFTTKGTIYRLDGTNINGQATIFLNQDNITYGVETVAIDNGAFTYEKTTKALPAGTYTLLITARDTLGNEATFTLPTLTIANELTITLDNNNQHNKPGTKLSIGGTVKTKDKPVNSGSISWTFEDIVGETTITSGTFDFSVTLPTTATTGEHILTITAKDEFGNTGETTLTYIIDAQPTDLTLLVEEGTFAPQEIITVTATVHDQAGILYEEDITLTVKDAEGTTVFTDVLTSGTSKELQLPVFATPGTWNIKAETNTFTTKKTFNVKTYKQLDYKLEGNSLIVTNIGNVPYKEPVKITMQGFERPVNVVRNLNLEVNESETIDLGEGTPTGAYSVSVGEKTFANVPITGHEKKDYSWAYYVILALLVFTLVYFFMLRSTGQPERKKEYDYSNEDLQEKVNLDLARTAHEQTQRHLARKHMDNTPILGKDVRLDKFTFHSHGSRTIFGRRREEQKKRQDDQSGFSGMFD
ncbi:MAG: hypothetical protein Q7R96_04460 [Nanoarchaeota archaeon]|nr:hypothetical protein [Nanoarchaeota archaeon]